MRNALEMAAALMSRRRDLQHHFPKIYPEYLDAAKNRVREFMVETKDENPISAAIVLAKELARQNPSEDVGLAQQFTLVAGLEISETA